MKTILVLGAGFSSVSLIEYLLDNSASYNWFVRLGDISLDLAKMRIGEHPGGEAIFFNVDNHDQLAIEVKNSDIVVSLLPAKYHYNVALACVRYGKDLVTASYISKEIEDLDEAAKEKKVLLLNEMGVDPGIDHMSAMNIINRLKDEGAEILEFESATGGLVAPEYDNNPWRYKFTWNPWNVVLAGYRGARFMHNGKFKYIPYHKLFKRYEIIEIPEYGQFEVYPNRDSLKYQDTYGLKNLLTMFRGTIRRPGFCEAWDQLIQIGATDNSYIMEGTENMTYREFTNSFLAYNMVDPVEKKLADYLQIEEDSELMKKLSWLGLFDDTVIGLADLTPAQVLQKFLEKKWKMDKDDRDMIIMQHQFDYNRLGSHRKLFATMVAPGENESHTAMSKTVGLPLAIATKLILNGEIDLKGAQIPVHKQIYKPVLKELEDYGIRFIEKDMKLT